MKTNIPICKELSTNMKVNSDFPKGKHSNTEVTALVGGFGLFKHLIEVFCELSVPFHELIHEHNSETHANHVLPWIYKQKPFPSKLVFVGLCFFFFFFLCIGNEKEEEWRDLRRM